MPDISQLVIDVEQIIKEIKAIIARPLDRDALLSLKTLTEQLHDMGIDIDSWVIEQIREASHD